MYRKGYGFKIYGSMEDDGRTCVVIIALDKSGSMTAKEEIVYNATEELLKGLARKNETGLDFEFRVILMVFDTEVHIINADYTPLPPEQVLELFERKDYKCSGGTSLAAVFTKLDQMFSRQGSGLLNQAQNGDLYPMVVFISDYVATDDEESYENAKNRLLDNRFYEKTNRLCVYVGAESRRSAAAELVGSEDNVLPIAADLESLLTPVVMGSTIMSTDATHIGNATKTPAEVAEEQKQRAEEGKHSAGTLNEEELQKELIKLLGGEV